MPKVISHTPPWLCRPSPAASFFTGKTSAGAAAHSQNGDEKKESYEGPQRTLARRGTEVFAVVDNQIRWSNLATLKDEWQTRLKSKGKPSTKESVEAREHYRVRITTAHFHYRDITDSTRS